MPHACKISTGKSENKFGIPLARAREVYAHARNCRAIEVTGTDVHIGQPDTDLAAWRQRFGSCPNSCSPARRRHTIHMSISARLGIPYYMDREGPRARCLCRDGQARVHNLGCTLMFEPGG